ncbi:MAG: VOC family protein [Minisyncoccota bacterium]
MSKVSIYLNFNRNTAEAFEFYKKIFKTEYVGSIMYMGDVSAHEGQIELPDEDKKLIMHIALPILGGLQLMGTDATESMGMKVNFGNNIYINLEPDTRAEVDSLFAELSDGGKVEQKPQEMFWGDYWGSCTDKFGVQWMFNTSSKI